LLLTLPGVPFIYYGEEIGMTGDKPDPRLRTPMHWSLDPAAGFTSGTPWEPLQPDSLTANVEAQEADSSSLLNLHRRLIHLRSENIALGAGGLLPLTAGNQAVAAYLRHAGASTVIVVANLGASPVSDVSLSVEASELSPGQYAATSLLGGPAASNLRVLPGGRIEGYVPLDSLAPLEVHVLEITAATE
jgi:glycosidase